LCDEKDTKRIEKFEAMDLEELKKFIKKKDKEISTAESDYEYTKEKFDKKLKRMEKKKDKLIKKIKNAGLGLAKATLSHREAAASDDEEDEDDKSEL